jgi:hypothetical protein
MLCFMEGLIKAIADFFATLLSAVGFVGRPRRREHIREDMKLLSELAEHPDIGRGSWPHQALMNRVALDVGRLAGVPGVHVPGTRKVQWSALVMALLIGGLCTFLTFKLNEDAFEPFSIIPGLVAFLMAITAVQAVIGATEQENDGDDDDDAELPFKPLGGDVREQAQADQQRPGG